MPALSAAGQLSGAPGRRLSAGCPHPDHSAAELFQTPQIVAPTDFNLADATANCQLAQKLIKKKTETIEDTADYEIIRTGSVRNGNIALLNKHNRLIDYLVHYNAKHYSHIGQTVTQLRLWRRAASPYVQGITRRIFFYYFLQNYPAIMSDGSQTPDGRSFWLGRMAEATSLGYRVGLVDLYKRQIAWFDPSHSAFEDWISDHDKWGGAEPYQGLRYLISN